MEHTISTIEKMLGGEFSSDPRCSRFPLPKVPEGTPEGISYTHSGVIVKPEMARDWVLHRSIRRDLMPAALLHEHVVPNRKYLVAYAKEFSRKLQRENWWNKGTHQGAAFTPDGYILDAQHRFAACAISGVPIILPVAVNVPWSAFKDIDQNRNRSAHQMLDIPYATTAASTARYLLPVIHGEWRKTYAYKNKDYNEQVIEICLGWPYFQEDQSWMREVHEAAAEAGMHSGALGAVVIGALASGVNPDDVQQFINGLRPISRNVNYIEIGAGGGDPRQLALRFFRKKMSENGGRKTKSATEERAYCGAIRHAMNVWVARHTDSPIKISRISAWSSAHDLPPVGSEKNIYEFHTKHVN